MRRPRKKKRKVTITMARNLYVLALWARYEATGEPVADCCFEERPTTYQQTWFKLVEKLVGKGWRPPATQPPMPPQKSNTVKP